jgi:hypothetical protein
MGTARALAAVVRRDGPTATDDEALHSAFRTEPRTKFEINTAWARAVDAERHTTPGDAFGVVNSAKNLFTMYGCVQRRAPPSARRAVQRSLA